ncbi:MAG: response regulator [Chloroflexi bacterium]|nr:response regulator [Chloroflexota bacterium]
MQYLALIVEDDNALRLIYRQILEPMQFQVLEASNGPEALNLLQSNTPHIVFLDMLLPYINGQTILDYLQTAPHLKNTLVIITTAHKQFQEVARNIPDAQFILKPIQPAEVREAARRAIARVRA